MKKEKLAIIVDDDPMILDLLNSIITPLGYEVELYNNPLEIPCIFGDNIPDLLLTDIRMPGMSGIEFIFQSLSRGCKVEKIGIMSGYWEEGMREIAESLNCKQFTKPFNPGEIREWVEELPETN